MALETVTQLVAMANGSAVLVLTLLRIRERLRRRRGSPSLAGGRRS